MTCLLIILKSDDAAVHLKLNAIDCTSTEIFIVAVSGMMITCISILTDLFLLVGIEDNCRVAMRLFTWWNSFCISLKCMLVIGALTWKVTRENVSYDVLVLHNMSFTYAPIAPRFSLITAYTFRLLFQFTVIIRWLLLIIVALMIKSHYTRRVHAYYRQVKPLNTLQSMLKGTARAAALNLEQQNNPGQSESKKDGLDH
ncbi:uncharacterized protein LOC125943283 [Dermacentor silvarum]|uniref:uncharacterized protein LOC125943283 n=1 Tax=Dermacentor silvarum TaxID=543639 RepID=UPI002101A3F7|nr:uncharacterized protein LOC125943283 [Dermacentor silvarum]